MEASAASGLETRPWARWLNLLGGRIVSVLESQTAPVHLAIALLLVLLIGWADWKNGWELSFFIFYALPISLAAWFAGKKAGYLVALASSAAWWIAVSAENPYKTEVGLVWAFVTRLFYFGTLCVGINAIRNRHEADAARIHTLEERRQLERDIVAVSEHEQQRIGQDLHDGLCQQLAAIGCAVRALAEDLRALAVPAADDAEMIEASIQRATVEARSLARGIFPVHVDRDGLAVALGDLARTMSRLTGVEIDVRERGDFTFDAPEKAMHLYRIAQEAVANAVRHGKSSHITIHLDARNDQLELRIVDDGIGINEVTAGRGKGMGMRTMRYRAQAVGDCNLTIASGKNGGTIVRCVLRNLENEITLTNHENQPS